MASLVAVALVVFSIAAGAAAAEFAIWRVESGEPKA